MATATVNERTQQRRGQRQRQRRFASRVMGENAWLRYRLRRARNALRFERKIIRDFLAAYCADGVQCDDDLAALAVQAVAEASKEVALIENEQDRGLPVGHMVQRDVENLHRAFGAPVGDYAAPAISRPELRASLVLEEAAELAASLVGATVEVRVMPLATPGEQWEPMKVIKQQSLVGAIDGGCDLLCVTYGTFAECGVEAAPFWEEVHRTNLAKQGGPEREDGKQLKPPGWTPPDIEGVLARELGEAARRDNVHDLEVVSA